MSHLITHRNIYYQQFFQILNFIAAYIRSPCKVDQSQVDYLTVTPQLSGFQITQGKPRDSSLVIANLRHDKTHFIRNQQF